VTLLARSVVSGLIVGSLVAGGTVLAAAVMPDSASAATGSAATFTTAALDPDAANAPFPDLAVTVSQSTDLLSQGIVVSWTGAEKSTRPTGSTGGENFLQIAQCWGEDPLNPGHPDRTTCQYGAFLSAGSTRDGFVDAANVDANDTAYTAPGSGQFFDPPYTAIPFVAAGGLGSVEGVKTVNGVITQDTSVNVNTNQFFTNYTSNEVTWAGSNELGEGSVKFELQTSLQSPGLGCGQPVVVAGQPTVGQSCWLVVIPRGEGDSGESSIRQSGLFWDAWKHNIAVKLDFKPVGVRCEIGAAERQLSGSELMSAAVASWQPSLCTGTDGAAYVVSTGSEADALAAAADTIPSPLAMTSSPLGTGAADPLRYAPIALSGVALTLSIDRELTTVGDIPQEYADRATNPFTEMKLTPRLVAKLLTGSYYEGLPSGADLSHIGYVSSANPGHNARNLTTDPDFLAINDPEWAYQNLSRASLADLLVPSGRSDLATQLWSYVMADAEAVAYLNGTPDPWGMIVNPWYSTSNTVNPNGSGLALPTDNFPKADPAEKPATTGSNGTGPVNLVTWRPYTSDFEQGANLVLRGDGQVLGGWDPTAVPAKYQKTPRSLLGEQKVLAVTTTAAAARYQNVTVALLNPAGSYVAPTEKSMQAAAAAMTVDPTSSAVYRLDPTSTAARGATTAYPLTMPVYAALNPLQTDATLRGVYANFIRYAVGGGQVVGEDLGQLPAGYAPIPQGWVDQALASATAIQNGVGVIQQTQTPGSASNSGGSYYTGGDSSGGASGGDPAASGDPAGALVGDETPDDPDSDVAAMAVPLGFLAGLLASIAVPVLPRIRRRF